jgi:hypothetical protein
MTGERNYGLVQRLQLTVWPDDIGSWQWVDRLPNASARVTYDSVFPATACDRAWYRQQAACPWFQRRGAGPVSAMDDEIQASARSGELPPTLESHLLKMPKKWQASLLFGLIEGAEDAIPEGAMLQALSRADYLKSHVQRLYAAGEEGARLIVERRQQLPDQFALRDVQRKAWATLADRDAVAAAIDLLVATHHCREVPPAPSPTGGRPTTAYFWNPLLKMEG